MLGKNGRPNDYRVGPFDIRFLPVSFVITTWLGDTRATWSHDRSHNHRVSQSPEFGEILHHQGAKCWYACTYDGQLNLDSIFRNNISKSPNPGSFSIRAYIDQTEMGTDARGPVLFSVVNSQNVAILRAPVTQTLNIQSDH